MQNLIMVRYGEIYLKGLNRPYFLRALVSRVRQAAKPFGGKVWLHDARVFVSDMQDVDACMEAVRRVFGVHSVCPAVAMAKDDFTAICAQAESMMRPLNGTFKVEARRSDKRSRLIPCKLTARWANMCWSATRITSAWMCISRSMCSPSKFAIRHICTAACCRA